MIVDSTISITHNQSLSAPEPGCLAADIACASDSEHHGVALPWQGHEATINKCSFFDNGGFTLDPSFATKEQAVLIVQMKKNCGILIVQMKKNIGMFMTNNM